MPALTIINDTHCGVVRSGGTTPKSAWALRQWVLERFGALLQAIDTDLLILGDLLDAYTIPYLDLLAVLDKLSEWCTDNPEKTLYLVPGNHDLSKTISTMSSFQFLCRLMGHRSNAVVIDKPGHILKHNAYVIPHVVNQEQFDIEIAKVMDFEKGSLDTLYLHCNFDNKFAQRSDHSLNLSADQALKLPVKHIVFAHEHQHKTAINGKVQIIGNQIPTSVADCLGNRVKSYLVVDGGNLEYPEVWDEDGSFYQADWHELLTVPAEAQFIRVTGDASASEANAVVTAISKLRNIHSAFVVTNAVKIEGRSGEIEAKSLEQAQTYDVREALMRRLSEAQRESVKQLLAEHDGTA